MEQKIQTNSKIAIFKGKKIRKTIHNDEWGKRGVKEDKEYAILTAEISKAAFGVKPSDHKKLKNLKKENLKDHMSDLELIFSMLGEASTTEIAVQKGAKGFKENKKAAKEGGTISGNARKELEEKTGKKIITSANFLNQLSQNEDSNSR